MSKIAKQACLPYSQAQLYALVEDVNAYPEYLPGCERAEVHEQSSAHMLATLWIKKAWVTTSFTTENTLQPPHSLEMSLKKGPFKHLTGVWRFVECEGGCVVEFALDFEFQSGMVNQLFRAAFNHLSANLFDAFCQRAHAVYGKKT